MIANGFGLRPGLRGLNKRLPAHLAGSLGVVAVAGREPAGAVRGDEQAVAARREELPDVVEDAPQGLARGAQFHVFIDLEGVGHRLAVVAAVDAQQHGVVGRVVAAPEGDVVAEGHDGLVVGQAGEDVGAELVKVGLEVAAEVVEAHPVVDEHLVVGPLEGRIDAVAGRQEDGCEHEEI